MRELSEKGKKAKSNGKKGEIKIEGVGKTKGLLISKGKESVVMMARRKELFVDHEKDIPMLLLAHCLTLMPLIFLFLLLFLMFCRIMRMSSQRNCQKDCLHFAALSTN